MGLQHFSGHDQFLASLLIIEVSPGPMTHPVAPNPHPRLAEVGKVLRREIPGLVEFASQHEERGLEPCRNERRESSLHIRSVAVVEGDRDVRLLLDRR